MKDLKKAREIIYDILLETNLNMAKEKLKKIDTTLWSIIHDEANNQ